jgi:hypothetical protein
MTAPSCVGQSLQKHLANRAVPHMSQSQYWLRLNLDDDSAYSRGGRCPILEPTHAEAQSLVLTLSLPSLFVLEDQGQQQ